MTEQEYNAAEGIRRSDLWRMEDSPEKFRWFLEHPDEQTPAMAFGSACHKFILEPSTFADEYVIAPVLDKRTKAGKEAWEKLVADNPEKGIVSADDGNTMAEMSQALGNCPLARNLLRGKGQTEVPIFWKDPETGERCKAKLDKLTTDDDGKYIIIDYKTAASADTFKFNASIWKLGYHFQAGFYTEGLMNVLGIDYRPRFLFVVQEKKAPYSVNVIEVSEEVMYAGVAKFHELLQKYCDCKAVDMWPGYVQDVPNDSYVPGWMEREMEDEFE